jgi:hypothetical protein
LGDSVEVRSNNKPGDGLEDTTLLTSDFQPFLNMDSVLFSPPTLRCRVRQESMSQKDKTDRNYVLADQLEKPNTEVSLDFRFRAE